MQVKLSFGYVGLEFIVSTYIQSQVKSGCGGDMVTNFKLVCRVICLWVNWCFDLDWMWKYSYDEFVDLIKFMLDDDLSKLLNVFDLYHESFEVKYWWVMVVWSWMLNLNEVGLEIMNI